MVSAKELLEDFVRDIIKHVGDRPKLIAGYAKILELKEEAIRKETNNAG